MLGPSGHPVPPWGTAFPSSGNHDTFTKEIINVHTTVEEDHQHPTPPCLLRKISLVIAVSLTIASASLTAQSPQSTKDELIAVGKEKNSDGHWGAAIEAFEKVVALDREDYSAYDWLGASWLAEGRSDRPYMKDHSVDEINGEFEHAIQAFTKAYAIVDAKNIGPGWKDHLSFELSEAYMEKRDFGAAFQWGQQCIQANAQNGDCHLGIGDIFAAQGSNDDAIREYQKAISLDSSDPWDYFAVAKIQFKQKHYQETLEWASKSIDHFPKGTTPSGSVYELLGDTYDALGQEGKAASAYSKATWRNREKMMHMPCDIEKEHLEEGLRSCRQIIWMDPLNVEALVSMGVALYNADRDEEAFKYATRANGLEPDDPDGWLLLGSIYAGKTDYKRAIEDAQEGLDAVVRLTGYERMSGAGTYFEWKKSAADIQCFAGFEGGEYQTAIEACEFLRRISMDPQKLNSNIYYRLGKSYAVLGDYENARAVFGRASRAYPNDIALYDWLVVATLAEEGMDAAYNKWYERHPRSPASSHELDQLLLDGMLELAHLAEQRHMQYAALDHYTKAFVLHWDPDWQKQLLLKIIAIYKRLPLKPLPPRRAQEALQTAQDKLRRGDVALFENACWSAINLAPWWPEAHYNRGLFFAEMWGDPHELELYLELAPNGAYASTARDELKTLASKRSHK